MSKNIRLGLNLSVESISTVKMTVVVIFLVVKINYLTIGGKKSIPFNDQVLGLEKYGGDPYILKIQRRFRLCCLFYGPMDS